MFPQHADFILSHATCFTVLKQITHTVKPVLVEASDKDQNLESSISSTVLNNRFGLSMEEDRFAGTSELLRPEYFLLIIVTTRTTRIHAVEMHRITAASPPIKCKGTKAQQISIGRTTAVLHDFILTLGRGKTQQQRKLK